MNRSTAVIGGVLLCLCLWLYVGKVSAIADRDRVIADLAALRAELADARAQAVTADLERTRAVLGAREAAYAGIHEEDTRTAVAIAVATAESDGLDIDAVLPAGLTGPLVVQFRAQEGICDGGANIDAAGAVVCGQAGAAAAGASR
ncbi:hypothetical protein LJC59_01255 [Desulfovibrio sp. OttesenSCG-928-A18]|nr:hypothetical protein [Desulfovibrio sp. OttesenSCG-928-A18]